MGSAACVSSGPIEVRTETNLAPRFLHDQLDPKPSKVQVRLTDTTLFTVRAVQDPNVGDTLTFRWFLDYKEFPFPLRGDVVVPPNLNATDPTTRTGATLPTLRLTRTELERTTNPTGPHYLELLVSDRGFVDSTNPEELNRAVPSGALVGQVAWTIEVIP